MAWGLTPSDNCGELSITIVRGASRKPSAVVETVDRRKAGARHAMADTSESQKGKSAITIDQLVALNDEIAALSRSGMPLERGLMQIGSDLPGRLGDITRELSGKMTDGASLSEALRDSSARLPKVYRAVVDAGLRAGNLPVALEGLSTFARNYAEARRSIGLALLYPMIVLALAYVLFVFIVTVVMPRFALAFLSLGLDIHPVLGFLEHLGATSRYWGPILPAAGIVAVFVWLTSGSVSSLDGNRSLHLVSRLPWLGLMLRGYEAASFSDLLALLIEHDVPFPDAIELAGDGSGDAAVARVSRELAASIRRGDPSGERLKLSAPFPPLLQWLLATAPLQKDNLVRALRQMSQRYRGQASYQAEKLRIFLPIILLLGIGATATLLYTLALFLPMTSLWTSLANQAP